MLPPVAAGKRNASELTKRAVDKALPAAAPYFLWDREPRGFGLHVAASGLRTFVFQYRTQADLRSRRITIGRYGAWTVDAARKEARALAAKVSKGEDPVAQRRETRAAETMDQLFDLYLTDHAATKNAPRTVDEVTRLLQRKVRPVIGNLKVARITHAELARMHHGMKDTPRQANFALAVVSKALSLAESWGMREMNSNPCGRIARYPENHRTRFLRGSEVTRVGEALEEAETIGLPWRIRQVERKRKTPAPSDGQRTTLGWQALGVLRLLLMTGARLSEILELRWEHVDTESGTVALPGNKGSKREPHPVSSHVLALIDAFPVVRGSPWVFPRKDDAARHITKEVVENAWQRIRIRADLNDVRIHDLRHTAGTYATQAGVNAFIVRDLLRHRNVATTNRYSNFDAEPVRHVSDAIGDRIAAALAGGKSAEIVPLRRGGK